ncbi:MAG: VCBS repeat-containing protein [Deltaproteobacteria bacterium]|nr:VCBS repeat-containing protein [Deltaproteobacteria bacterium]
MPAGSGSSLATKITIPQPKAIATGDFDEDGDLDLAVANSGGNTVAIFRADGIADTVSFPNGSTFTVGYGPSALAVGDIDKDGHVDIAVTLAGTSVPDCSAVVLWGAGAGSFTTGATISAGTAATEMPTGIAIGTLDGDAYPELVIAKHDRTSPNAGHVRTLLNQGSGAHVLGLDDVLGRRQAGGHRARRFQRRLVPRRGHTEQRLQLGIGRLGRWSRRVRGAFVLPGGRPAAGDHVRLLERRCRPRFGHGERSSRQQRHRQHPDRERDWHLHQHHQFRGSPQQHQRRCPATSDRRRRVDRGRVRRYCRDGLQH